MFGLGGRRGIILIPKGCGGWGWRKFSNELRKISAFLSDLVGCGRESLVATVIRGASLSMAPKWTGPSYAEMVRSDPINPVKVSPTVEGRRSRLRASSVEPVSLDILPMVRHAEADTRSSMDCFTLESPQLDLLDKDRNFRPLGKKLIPRSNSKFEISNVHTWSKLGIYFDLALGRAIRKILGRFAVSGLDRKRSSFRLASLMSKPKVSRPSRLLVEMMPKSSSGMVMGQPPVGGLEAASLDTIEGAGQAKLVSLGCALRPGQSLSSVPGAVPVLASYGGGSCSSQVAPSRVTASKQFHYPPLLV